MKKALLIGIVIILIPIGFWIISKSRTFQFFGEIYSHVETSQKVVALTFDDGPTKRTDSILQILDELNIKATFYLNGENIKSNFDETKCIVKEGHELGNHSFSHERMIFKSYDFIRKEIDKTDSLIRLAGYDEEITFRPPFGKKLFFLPYYLNQNKRKTIMWNIEPESYNDIAQNSKKIVNHIMENIRPGAIILLHVLAGSREESVNSLKPIVNGLKGKGYEFKTVSELLQVAN